MIYFDNAASSHPKPDCVLKDFKFCLKKCSGNAGRGSHKLSLYASEKIYEAREAIAEHFNLFAPEGVVFTYNATYALNMALRAKIKPDSHIITSDIEHNAVVRPLELLKSERKISCSHFCSDGDIEKNICALIRPETSAIVSTIASNVTGKRIPLSILSGISKKYGLTLIIDGSQAAGHERINLKNNPCDCFCAPGHKGLFGIQGSGFVCFSSSENLSAFIAGGSGTNSKSPYMPRLLPERFEAGTLSAPIISSLRSGVGFIEDMGVEEIQYKEKQLACRLKEGISAIKGIELYECFGGIVLFNFTDTDSENVCAALDERGVCVRGGLHCAPLAHKVLGTEKIGAVRISLSYFNQKSEIDRFLKILSKIRAEI